MAEPARALNVDADGASVPRSGPDSGSPPRPVPGGRTGASGADAARRSRPASRSRIRYLAVAGIVVVAIGGGAAYWLHARNYESTDDAFIDSDVVQINPRIGGAVIRLLIRDNQPVAKGDLLLEIDPRDTEAALDNAKAALEEAIAMEAVARASLELTRASTEATLRQATSGIEVAKATLARAGAEVEAAEAEAGRAKSDADRYQALMRSDSASRQRLEQAVALWHSSEAQLKASRHAVQVAVAGVGEAAGRLAEANTASQQIAVRTAELGSATARVAAARAAVETAEINLSYTRIHAPHDGVITKKAVQEGDVVQKDQNLAALVFGTPYVTANFKETQLARMRPGQPVDIAVDAYPGTALKGRVDSIQRGTGAHFSLLPPENATGNFVKIVQRVPVKIVFDEPPDPRLVLGPGMSVVPRVKVRGEGAAAGEATSP